MASYKMRNAIKEEENVPKMDMSPMIDMVFLLLIFFLVTSQLIKIRQDPEVEVAVAPNAQDIGDALGRLVINIYKDGKLANVDGDPLSVQQLEVLSRDLVKTSKASGKVPRLHVRADRRAEIIEVKKAIGAAARGGIADVVVASFKQDKYNK